MGGIVRAWFSGRLNPNVFGLITLTGVCGWVSRQWYSWNRVVHFCYYHNNKRRTNIVWQWKNFWSISPQLFFYLLCFFCGFLLVMMLLPVALVFRHVDTCTCMLSNWGQWTGYAVGILLDTCAVSIALHLLHTVMLPTCVHSTNNNNDPTLMAGLAFFSSFCCGEFLAKKSNDPHKQQHLLLLDHVDIPPRILHHFVGLGWWDWHKRQYKEKLREVGGCCVVSTRTHFHTTGMGFSIIDHFNYLLHHFWVEQSIVISTCSFDPILL